MDTDRSVNGFLFVYVCVWLNFGIWADKCIRDGKEKFVN